MFHITQEKINWKVSWTVTALPFSKVISRACSRDVNRSVTGKREADKKAGSWGCLGQCLTLSGLTRWAISQGLPLVILIYCIQMIFFFCLGSQVFICQKTPEILILTINHTLVNCKGNILLICLQPQDKAQWLKLISSYILLIYSN